MFLSINHYFIYRYKRIYDRRYADDTEEAVRKNVLMQSLRYTASGNRQGASFELGTTFLSDRLRQEREVLLGAAEAPAPEPGEPFPYSRAQLDALRGRLPRSFDWRERGAVTHVRSECPAPRPAPAARSRRSLTRSTVVCRSGLVRVVLGLRDGGRSGGRAVRGDGPPRGAERADAGGLRQAVSTAPVSTRVQCSRRPLIVSPCCVVGTVVTGVRARGRSTPTTT